MAWLCNCVSCFAFISTVGQHAFSALTLLVGWREVHPWSSHCSSNTKRFFAKLTRLKKLYMYVCVCMWAYRTTEPMTWYRENLLNHDTQQTHNVVDSFQAKHRVMGVQWKEFLLSSTFYKSIELPWISNVFVDFWPYFYCACAEIAVPELPVTTVIML